ncbi:hypothetical protein ABTZ03_37485 [Kitasatospora sp. NPDC096077]|uniref:hypothetical protein n=1 Tax=Kitasatospora sp. NPDC096077 TaxID=3155544 RepID=UPI003319DCC0
MKVPRKALAKSAVAVLLAGFAMAPGVAQSSAVGRLGSPAPLTSQTAAHAVAGQLSVPEREVGQRLAAQDGLSNTAKAFRTGQGAKDAGVWLDVMRGEVHANVVDDEGERAAKAAGIIPQRAAYTTADLREVYERLNEVGRKGLMPPDSSWEVDTGADRVALDVQAGKDAEAVLRAAGVTEADRAKGQRHHPPGDRQRPDRSGRGRRPAGHGGWGSLLGRHHDPAGRSGLSDDRRSLLGRRYGDPA